MPKRDELDVLGQIYVSFINNLPIPERVSDAFVEKYIRGRDGAITSWDDVFGRPSRHGSGEKLERRIKQQQIVVDEIERLKAEGRSLNEEEFAAIGQRTGVGGKSKVKELLHDGRLWAERVRLLYGFD